MTLAKRLLSRLLSAGEVWGHDRGENAAAAPLACKEGLRSQTPESAQ